MSADLVLVFFFRPVYEAVAPDKWQFEQDSGYKHSPFHCDRFHPLPLPSAFGNDRARIQSDSAQFARALMPSYGLFVLEADRNYLVHTSLSFFLDRQQLN